MNISFHIDKKLEGAVPYPEPSGKFLPEYYKKIASQADSNPQSGTVKRCVPFLESMRMGYIIPLWADMYVDTREDKFHVEFPRNYAMDKSLDTHAYDQMPEHPLSETPHGKSFLKFINPWIIETEPGVSCMFTSPFNHMESRFKILDGVVDTDNYYNNIHFPFLWLKPDEENFIARGTPLVQVIPFRREQTAHAYGVIDEKRKQQTQSMLGTKMRHGYRDLFWNKKAKDNHTPPHDEHSDH